MRVCGVLAERVGAHSRAMSQLHFKRAKKLVSGAAVISAANRLTAPGCMMRVCDLLAERFGAC